METTDAIKKRKSTRAFLPEIVPTETVKKLLNLAKQAPSWVNSQPEHVYALSGSTLDQLKKEYQQASANGKKSNPDIPMMARDKWSKQCQANMQKWNEGLPKTLGPKWGEEMGKHSDVLYNVPNLLILTLPKGYSAWSLYDLGSFGNSFVLAATDAGLATMTAYQFIKYPDILRQVLNIPDDEDVIIGIGFGHADSADQINQIQSERMDLGDFVSFEN